MDVNTALTLVSAAAAGAATEAGRQAWQSLISLARRISGRPDAASAPLAATSEVDPGDAEAVRVLHGRLAAHAREDAAFAVELCRWAETHRVALQLDQSQVHNTIADTAQISGPVIQAHTITGDLTFGSGS